jgi:hypothetical protein
MVGLAGFPQAECIPHRQLSTQLASVSRFAVWPLQNADSIRLSFTEVMRVLAAGHIDRKTASLMIYALQVATSNLPETNPCDA